MFPKTDIDDGWGEHGTEGGPHASFFKRYHGPLARYARAKFKVDADRAEDLVSRYLTRQLERDRARGSIFRLYDPEKGRFRSLLAVSFWRFARDELDKDLRQPPLFLGDDEPGAEDDEFCRLVAREFFNALRRDIARGLADDERRVLDLQWPEDPAAEPAGKAAIERALGLSRARVRTIAARIADRFTYQLRRRIHAAGLSPDEARDLLGDCCRVLDQEQRRSEGQA